MTRLATPPAIEYPDDDGNPLSDNTLQFRWIMTLQGGFDALFRDDPNVFVAGDLLWYPVEGDVNTRQAPDVMVVFGRPKGYRGSYRQWEEGGVAPQVAFEVLSPGNRAGEMARKLAFYERYGVEEYYIYDPDRVKFEAHLRGADGRLGPVPSADGHVSPRLGVRFDLSGPELAVINPGGTRFLTYLELVARAEQAEGDRRRAEAERRRAESERQREEAERLRAEAERQQIATQFEQLKEKLRAAGIDPDALGGFGTRVASLSSPDDGGFPMAERTEFPATHDRPAPPGADVYDPTGTPYGPQPNGVDAAAGGADSSPYDTEPSGDRGAVAAHERYMNRSGQNEPAGQPSQLARD